MKCWKCRGKTVLKTINCWHIYWIEKQQYRANKKASMYLKMSDLRYRFSLEEITLNKERNLTKSQLLILSSTHFIDKAQNVIITGATGCGKSFLACAVGQNICNLGIKVSYFNINRLVEKINLAHLNGTYVRFLNRLQKIPLLIFDDFELKSLDKQAKLEFLQILEDVMLNIRLVLYPN